MKANKRIRSLKRRSLRKLYIVFEGRAFGVTTYPVDSGRKANDVQDAVRFKSR